MMTDQPFQTRPPTEVELQLREKFAELLPAQLTQVEQLGQQLLTLELAIPGLYATALALVHGGDATLAPGWPLTIAFGLWFIALLLTWLSLLPRRWRVNPTIMRRGITPTTPQPFMSKSLRELMPLLRRDDASRDEELGIEEFFERATAYKSRLLMFASVCFFGGVLSAVLAIV